MLLNNDVPLNINNNDKKKSSITNSNNPGWFAKNTNSNNSIRNHNKAGWFANNTNNNNTTDNSQIAAGGGSLGLDSFSLNSIVSMCWFEKDAKMGINSLGAIGFWRTFFLFD